MRVTVATIFTLASQEVPEGCGPLPILQTQLAAFSPRVEQLLELPALDEWQAAVVSSPTADGGFGMQPLAAICEAAFVGGQASAPARPGERPQILHAGRRDADVTAAVTGLRRRWGSTRAPS